MRNGWTWLEVMRYVAIFSMVICTIGVGLGVGAGLGAAQEQTPAANSTEAGEDIERIEYELQDVDIVSVEFVNGSALVTAKYNDGATVAITDSGSVKGLGSNSGAGVSFNTYSRGEGTYELRLPLQSDDQLITIQQGDKMYAASGDRGVIDIISGAPDAQIVQWGALSGGLGTIISLGLVVGGKRRTFYNSYKELFSEERKRINENPVEGFLGRVSRWVTNNKYALILSAVTIAYLLAVRLRMLPSPSGIWEAMTDAQRVLVVGAMVMSLLMLIPVYILASRLWDPAKEYIIDVDARDVLDESIGSKGGLASLDNGQLADAENIDDAVEEINASDDMTVVAVYSGSPERISQMRIEGAAAYARTPAGDGHIVQGFDPERNVAEGTWPGLADELELVAERSKIDSNRELLEDYATVGRRIISAIPAIRAGADTAAVAAVDKKFAESSAIDGDPVDNVMDAAVEGTQFEKYYSDDDGDERHDRASDEANEVVNDDDDNEGDN